MQPPAKAGQLTQEHGHGGFGMPPKWRLHNPPAQPVPGLCCPQHKEVLAHVEVTRAAF